jgi:hypothetical protein
VARQLNRAGAFHGTRAPTPDHTHVQLAGLARISVPCGFVDGLPIDCDHHRQPDRIVLRLACLRQRGVPRAKTPGSRVELTVAKASWIV